ncbi:MAG TPA: ABC-F type ribosomal protection protein [Ruminococcaceae bacterium]|nr:ABC-F type ribosomal protection protein [Oscillospiraceae bacterium]
MSIISITNLTFAYDGGYENIFENVSFRIDTDWKIGLTGRNGRGKTTFLKLLMKQYEYEGTVSASTEFEYFPYEVSSGDSTALGAVEQIAPGVQYWQILKEINLLETEEEILYRPFNTLSKGEQTKILLAAMFLRENSFLLIDEPTNHLDIKGRESVSRYLNGKKGFILVSHDRLFLDGCIDHILSINKTDIQIQKGNFSSWLINKERQDSFELAENNKLKKEIKRMEKAVKETVRWSDKAEARKIGIDPIKVDNKKGYRPLQAAKSKKLMARAKAIETRRENALEEKTKLLKNTETADKLKIGQLEYRSERLLTVQKLSAAYSEKPLFENLSFEINMGDRIWLKGKNGSGKSTLIRLMLEASEGICQNGLIEKGSGLKISYVPQDASGLKGRLSDYAREYDIEDSLFKAILSKLDFSDLRFDRKIEDMSQGQKKKILIARSLCEKVHLHIWDEPMNYIDVISRMQIEEMLLEYKPTVLFVEHDGAFGEKIANKVISLDNIGLLS